MIVKKQIDWLEPICATHDSTEGAFLNLRVFFFFNRNGKKMKRLSWRDVPQAWCDALKLNWDPEQELEMEHALWLTISTRQPKDDEKVTFYHPYLESRMAVELLLDRCTVVRHAETRSTSPATEHKATIKNELKTAAANHAELLTPQESAVKSGDAIAPHKTPFRALETKVCFICREADEVRTPARRIATHLLAAASAQCTCLHVKKVDLKTESFRWPSPCNWATSTP